MLRGIASSLACAHIGGHQSSRGNSAWHTGGPGSAIGLKIDFLRRVQHELDLTPDQHARINRILGESQERARKLMDPVRAQLQAEVKRAKEEFLEVLTPEQRPRFEELWKQQRRQREQHEQHEQRRAPPSAERPARTLPSLLPEPAGPRHRRQRISRRALPITTRSESP